ncbi:hypothetical protein J7I94_12780 [Streptomyces sp. ISL-12]|uniref:hypothetical protein n=1 Tax=Streptomyces sp. ISL-12 TaxID=2819177 RepID=UPI001BE723ED|nr:hypothetical protein [Streptomyces sp. ISL-12]MBT2411435.1 hypothetical protein [Streptomyces sp. ISL-12]
MPCLTALMNRHGWVTVDLVRRESGTVFHARDPSPPAGSSRTRPRGPRPTRSGAACGRRAWIPLPSRPTVLQGYGMGRPSTITVTVPEDPRTGIGITGTAVPL